MALKGPHFNNCLYITSQIAKLFNISKKVHLKSIKDFSVSEELTWVSEQLVTDYLNTQGETPYLLEESEGETNENHEKSD